jgi:hypothetical protein
MSEFKPVALSIDAVMADPRLRRAVDQVAESIHDAWAATRLSQGWEHGQATDRSEKRHASLVPYDELPEAEKEIDRLVAATVVAKLVQLGIVKLTDSVSLVDEAQIE